MSQPPKDTNVDSLFSPEGTDPFYSDVRNETQPWHHAAKAYWQGLYAQHHPFLDKEFARELNKDCFSRLWELRLAEYISQHKGATLLQIQGQTSKPDFCFELQGKRFYLEAVCASPGTHAELQVPLSESIGKARSTPRAEYKERICAAIKLKGITKYYGEKACGYKCYMDDDSGLIIAISTAKITLNNHPRDPSLDLSCLFGMSDMKIPVTHNDDGRMAMGQPYYDHQPVFAKTSNRSLIDSNYFASADCSHISAVLISYVGQSLFPGIDKYDESCVWGDVNNDFRLIHNPFAKVPLPQEFWSVSKEIISRVDERTLTIHTPA